MIHLDASILKKEPCFPLTGGILRIPLIEYVDDYSYFEDG